MDNIHDSECGGEIYILDYLPDPNTNKDRVRVVFACDTCSWRAKMMDNPLTREEFRALRDSGVRIERHRDVCPLGSSCPKCAPEGTDILS